MNPNLNQNQNIAGSSQGVNPGDRVSGVNPNPNPISAIDSESSDLGSISSSQSNIQNQQTVLNSENPVKTEVSSVGMPNSTINGSVDSELHDNTNKPQSTQNSINKDVNQVQNQQAENQNSENSEDSKGSSRSKSRDIIKGEKPKESFLQKLNMYAIPIIAVIAIIILTILLYIPTINQILETRTDIENLQAEVDFSKNKLETLKSINLQDLDRLLGTVTKVVRDNMDVATLASEVESTAQENELKPSKISFQGSDGSSSLSSEDEMDSVSEYARSISGPFSFYGSKVNVVNFLRDLRLDSSTVLALSSVDIGKYSTQDESEDSEQLWSVDIEIRGYLVSPVTSTEVLAPISVDVDSDILEEIQTIVDEDYNDEEDVSEDLEETDETNETVNN